MNAGFAPGAGGVAGGMGPNGSTVMGMGNMGATAAAGQPLDETVFKDLMSLCFVDRRGNGGPVGASGGRSGDQAMRYLTGLLEVEPLHFTCYATSDGTRMERLEAGAQTSTVASAAAPAAGIPGLSGTINFGETLPPSSGVMLSSLSNAMASAEHQLQQLSRNSCSSSSFSNRNRSLSRSWPRPPRRPSWEHLERSGGGATR